jgi:hypothetical protein
MSDHTEEIRARVEKATPGPWLWDGDDCDETQDEPYIYIPCKDAKVKGAITVLFQADWATKEDAEFCAHARADIPYLLTELQALRQENARLKGALEEIKQETQRQRLPITSAIHEMADAALSSSPAQEESDPAGL